MKIIYVEVQCDGCGSAEHFRPPNVDDQAREHGWIVIGRRHYCGFCAESKNLKMESGRGKKNA